MNAFARPPRPASNSIGVDVFDCDRRTFLLSVQEMLADPKITDQDRADEIRATISVVRQMAILAGVAVDA